MKKIAKILVFLLAVATFAISCRTTQPTCPAYRSQINTEIPSNVN